MVALLWRYLHGATDKGATITQLLICSYLYEVIRMELLIRTY